jgi:hypothetical protein
MGDVAITAGNVRAGANAKKRAVRYGGTITAGLAVYEDSADANDAKAADCTTSAATASVAGIALNGGADGQPGEIVTEDDDFTPGGTLVAGTVYVLSTAGAICPIADVLANDYVTVLGVAKSTSKLNLKIIKSGVKL